MGWLVWHLITGCHHHVGCPNMTLAVELDVKPTGCKTLPCLIMISFTTDIKQE